MIDKQLLRKLLFLMLLWAGLTSNEVEGNSGSPECERTNKESVNFFLCPLKSVGGFSHPGGLHSLEQIEISRKNIQAGNEPWSTAYDSLMQEARKNLGKAPQAIADFNVPGYYDDAAGHRKAMSRLSEDAWVAYSCAIAYQLTAGKQRVKYGNKVIQILMAWASINKRTSNYDGDLAMSDAGTGLIFAAELMTGFKGWKRAQREVFKDWVRGVYLNSCTKIAKEPNNWGDWGNLGCMAAHYFLDDKKALNEDIMRVRDRIDQSIDADGSLPQEITRGPRGLWYTYFSLAPLTASCQIALNADSINLFDFKGQDGAGIEEALDYLLRYEKAPDTWPHYKEKNLRKGRPGWYPGNLFEAMSGIYGKPAYETWIRDARPIMVFGHHYAWAVPTLLRPLPMEPM
jgi:hypothetical protein